MIHSCRLVVQRFGGRRHLESRIDIQAACTNTEIVKAAAKAGPAELLDLQPSPLRPVVDREVVENDDAMSKTVKLHVPIGADRSSRNSAVHSRPAKN